MKIFKVDSIELQIDACLHTLLLDETDAYIFVKNLERKYVYVNQLTQNLFQKDFEDIVGYDDSHFFEIDALSDIIQNDNKVLDLGEVVRDREFNTIKDSKELKVYQSVKKPIYNSEDEIVGLVGVSTDITEMYLLKEQLKTQVFIDDMTSLHNRKSYTENIDKLLSQHKRYQTPFSCIMYDVDDFKQVNDIYGHKVGDKLLVEMSHLVKNLTRETDYVFRIGGEEFIVLLTETEINQAQFLAEKIRLSVEEKLKIIQEKKFTISLGVTEVKDGDTEDSIFKRVDSLLYKSKNSGKNVVTSG